MDGLSLQEGALGSKKEGREGVWGGRVTTQQTPPVTGLLGAAFILLGPLVRLIHPTAHLVCLLGGSECQASLGRSPAHVCWGV